MALQASAKISRGSGLDETPRIGYLREIPVVSKEVGYIPPEALYGGYKEANPIVIGARSLINQRALPLLSEANGRLDSDPIASDDAMNRLIPVLAELFYCREIGEGFAYIANALLSGVQNNASSRWKRHQLLAVAQELKLLCESPFISFEAGMGAGERLEDAGLVTEPPGFDALTDWLNGESVC